MERNCRFPIFFCITGVLAEVASAITPGSGYQVPYQINNANVAAIDRASDSQLAAAAFSATQDVKTVALNSGPVGPTLYTQPTLPSGLTFGGGFIASDGAYALTGQTGSQPSGGVFPGRLFLTHLSDGSSTALNLPGNYDATANNGNYYVTAAAGTATGLGSNSSSGLYQVQRTGGTLTGLNLILDTGGPSGSVVGDSAGNLAFSLGGPSASLNGDFNDVYRLSSTQVAAGVADGATTGLPASAADALVSGSAVSAAAAPFFDSHTPAGGAVFSGISDLIFNSNGDLIIGLSGFVYDSGFNFQGSIGEGLLFHINNNAGDYSGTFNRVVFSNDASGAGSFAYRASDNVLWVADGLNIYGIAAAPEPACLMLLTMALPLLGRRRECR